MVYFNNDIISIIVSIYMSSENFHYILFLNNWSLYIELYFLYHTLYTISRIGLNKNKK